jgi:hypothetical protein
MLLCEARMPASATKGTVVGEVLEALGWTTPYRDRRPFIDDPALWQKGEATI